MISYRKLHQRAGNQTNCASKIYPIDDLMRIASAWWGLATRNRPRRVTADPRAVSRPPFGLRPPRRGSARAPPTASYLGYGSPQTDPGGRGAALTRHPGRLTLVVQPVLDRVAGQLDAVGHLELAERRLDVVLDRPVTQ